MITLRKFTDGDLGVTVRSNAPELMTKLGGPETPGKVRVRAAKYADNWRTGVGSMFVMVTDDPSIDGGAVGDPSAVGLIGYWPTDEFGDEALEAGWTVFVPGRGFATEALRQLIAHAAEHSRRRSLYAYPRVDNDPSNRLCARVGFELLGEVDFEYPPGTPTVNCRWRYDLDAARATLGAS